MACGSSIWIQASKGSTPVATSVLRPSILCWSVSDVTRKSGPWVPSTTALTYTTFPSGCIQRLTNPTGKMSVSVW